MFHCKKRVIREYNETLDEKNEYIKSLIKEIERLKIC